MDHRIVWIISLITLMVMASVQSQSIRHVPSEYITIQEAVSAAEDGDTILIADGTYSGEGNFNIKFTSCSVTVRSENGPEACVMDCLWMGRGFTCDNFGDGCVISGLTIQNGCIMCEG